jgi:AraC family transcriptional regulator
MAAHALATGEFFGEKQRQHRCGGIVLSELKHRRKKALPVHTHESAFLCMLLSGGYREEIGSKVIDYAVMSSALHPAAFTHRDFVGHPGAHFFIAELSRGWLASTQEFYPVLSIEPRMLEGPAAELAQRLYVEHRRADTWSGLAIEGIMLELLAAVARLRVLGENGAPAWLPRVRELVGSSFQQSLTMREIAHHAGVDPVHLGRTFRRCTGESIAAFRNRLRLEFVCTLLRRQEASLTDIALVAGFADHSHMTRAFRQAYGITPSQYR